MRYAEAGGISAEGGSVKEPAFSNSVLGVIIFIMAANPDPSVRFKTLHMARYWLKNPETMMKLATIVSGTPDGSPVRPESSWMVTITCRGSPPWDWIVSSPVALVQSYIDSGALVPILSGFARPEVGMYAVYPPGRLIAGRVRVLSDALREHFRGRDI